MNAVEDWGDGRIEIELVEHEPGKRRFRRGAAGAQAPDAVSPRGDAPSHEHHDAAGAGERPPPRVERRTLALVAGVGAAGLLIGWLAGNAGDDSVAGAPASAPPSTTSVAASFADDPALVEPDVPVLSTAPTTTRRRPVTTSTAVPPPSVEVVALDDLDERLVGVQYEIVSEGSTGELRYVNLADGTLTTVRRRGGAGRVFAGDGWVAVPSPSAGFLRVITDGEPSFDPTAVDAWRVFHTSGAATLWIADVDVSNGSAGEIVETDIGGEPTGATVQLPGMPRSLDGPGAFIVNVAGDYFSVSADGPTLITQGALLAASPTTALAYECDEQLVCTYVVIDRADGTRRPIDTLVDLMFQEWWPTDGSSVSPDGRFATLVTVDRDQGFPWQLTAVDLESGQHTVLAPEFEHSTVRWTADSRFAFFVHDRALMAFDAETSEVLPVVPVGRAASYPHAFDIRPSTGSPWTETAVPATVD